MICKGRVWESKVLLGLGNFEQPNKVENFSLLGFGSSSMAVKVKEVGSDGKKKRKVLESKTMPSDRKVEAMQDSIGSSTEVDVQKPGSEEERMSDDRRILDDEVLV